MTPRRFGRCRMPSAPASPPHGSRLLTTSGTTAHRLRSLCRSSVANGFSAGDGGSDDVRRATGHLPRPTRHVRRDTFHVRRATRHGLRATAHAGDSADHRCARMRSGFGIGAGALCPHRVWRDGRAGVPRCRYSGWCRDLTSTLVEKLRFDPAAVTVLSEPGGPATAPTATNVRRVLTAVSQTMARDDLLLIVLIGHGTFDGVDAKFNLVGPDLESAEWARAASSLTGRVVIVEHARREFSVPRTAGGTPPHRHHRDRLRRRSASTPSFPEYFVRALADDSVRSRQERSHLGVGGVRRRERRRPAPLPAARAAVHRARAARRQRRRRRQRTWRTQGNDGSFASRTYLDESLPAPRRPTKCC